MKLSHTPNRVDGDDVIVSLKIRRANLGVIVGGVRANDVWLTHNHDGTYGLLIGSNTPDQLANAACRTKYNGDTGEIIYTEAS